MIYRDKQKYIIWSIIIGILFVFMIISSFFMSQNQYIYNEICSILGRETRYLISGDPAEYEYYSSDYITKASTLNAAKELNKKICEEGIVLLKNENSFLPLKSQKKISVFGKNSINLQVGGSGSSSANATNFKVDLYESLSKVGFTCNPILKEYYQNIISNFKSPSTPSIGSILTGFPIDEAQLPYSKSVKSSYSQYNEAAIVVLSRISGEGYDLPRTMVQNNGSYTDWSGTEIVSEARNKEDHYLQLDQNETDMLEEACNNFESVVVVINSASPMELGFLDDENHYAYHKNIKAAIWMGYPGANGTDALAEIMVGNINPSGKIADTFGRDFKENPTWNNFGNYLVADGNRYSVNGEKKNAYFVEYREGIYIGYRYYETRDYTEKINGNTDWYKRNVVYPFGYGLSYTNFEWEIEGDYSNPIQIDKNSIIEIPICVKNIGNFAGKDVIELFYTSPYTKNGIEKSEKVLGNFIKTDLLQPQEKRSYTLKIQAKDMASYDYNDANHNDFKGYELEKGNYQIHLSKDAHTSLKTIELNLSENIKYEEKDGKPVNNLFDDVSFHIEEYLSRADNFKNINVLEGASNIENREVSQDFINQLSYKLEDKKTDPWYTEESIVQSSKQLKEKDVKVKLYDLINKPYEDKQWEELLNQLTINQMSNLLAQGSYHTIAIENISKPYTIDTDGPMGFTSSMGEGAIYSTCYYASECVLANTWNEKMAYEMGRMIGNESLVGNEKGDGRSYSGWYAPAVNIHRSPFGGRNFEYYSEDGCLSGKIAQQVIKGAREKGVTTYVKHFALNEQETNRDTTGLITWANEQSMREIYFVPFEMSVKEGKTNAIMSSFNRIGTTWSGGNYNLLTKLLREEWGFKGAVITDYDRKNYMNVDQMLRAGGDLDMNDIKISFSNTTPTDISLLRRANKNILYMTVNSNAMNGTGEKIKWGTILPVWLIGVIILDVMVGLLEGVMIFILLNKLKIEGKKR